MLRTQELDVAALQRDLERKERELKLIADISALIGRAQPLRPFNPVYRVQAIAGEGLGAAANPSPN